MTTATAAVQRPAARVPRTRRAAPTRAVVAPPPQHRAPVWDRPIPVPRHREGPARPPLVWLLGAHGGAGVTSLARLLAPAADCHRRWPAPAAGESPYVLIVARETAIGLAAADALLRQHHAGMAGHGTVVGLVTVAARPGRIPTAIRRDRDLYAELVTHLWRIDWHEAWTVATHDALPVWSPTEGASVRAKSRDDLDAAPADVAGLGRELLTVIAEMEQAHTRGMGDRT